MKAVEVYAPISSRKLFEDVELAMGKVKTQYSVIMGDFNAMIGKKQAGDNVVRYYDILTRNSKREKLVEFSEINNVRIMNTFFRKQNNGKWTWKSPKGKT